MTRLVLDTLWAIAQYLDNTSGELSDNTEAELDAWERSVRGRAFAVVYAVYSYAAVKLVRE